MNLSRTVLIRGKLYHLQLQAGIHGTFWQVRDENGNLLREGRNDFPFLARIDTPTSVHSILEEQVNCLLRSA
jgi:hypothetical protein